MEPNQMGMGPQPMPNQPQPNQPMADQPTAGQPVMTMEEQAAITETISDTAPNIAISNGTPKKSNMAMILGMVLLVIVAIGGVIFGVMMMSQKDSEAKTYETQISDLKKTNSDLMTQLTEASALNGDEALALLDEAEKSTPFNIVGANVYAKYAGEEDEISFWVKYVYSLNQAPGAYLIGNIIFTQDPETEEWTFELPGFTESSPNYATYVADYEEL